ncbi:MAG: patatin family protein, partial [Firmicutes bacterium]|nr:patatin family protein [Bacillota bacterium]
MKTGLVLEGGGIRGIYTAGVLDVFLDEGIEFDGVIGVSAGVIHGCSYLSKQRGRSVRYMTKYCTDPRFMSFKSWLKTGDIVGAEFCYKDIPDRLDPFDHEAFGRRTAKFYATVTNLETGKAEHIELPELRQ